MQPKKNRIHYTEGKKRLETWMTKGNVTINKLTNLVGGHYQIVWHWCKGLRRPNMDSAKKLEVITEGFVPMDSWTIYLNTPITDELKNAKKKK